VYDDPTFCRIFKKILQKRRYKMETEAGLDKVPGKDKYELPIALTGKRRNNF
jgi:hypothetical protein